MRVAIRLRSVVLIGCLILSACISHKSSLQESEGKQTLFLIQNEHDVFSAAYDALTEAAPNFPVLEIDGPIRGYQVVWTEWLGQYATMVRIYPGKGTTNEGEVVSGYYAEVSGRGDIFRGPSFDAAVYNLISNKFAALGRKVFVKRIKRGKYRTDRDRWRTTNQPSLRDGGSITIKNLSTSSPSGNNSVSKRLEELEKLKAQGLVTEKEYQSLRSEILRDL